MPPELAKRCILAGSRPGDAVLDPFGGAGTTALVAHRLHRSATLIEINPDYAAIARDRLAADAGMFARVEITHHAGDGTPSAGAPALPARPLSVDRPGGGALIPGNNYGRDGSLSA